MIYMLNFTFKYNQDFLSVVGDNDSGKTTLIQRFILANVPPEKVFVLNSSNEESWYKYFPKQNITSPFMFTTSWFEQYILKTVAEHSGSVLVWDDVDNYNVKKSEILKSVVINARHLGLGIVIATRSLQELPILMYRQSKYAFFATQRSMYDRNYIATMIGLENARKLANLDKHVFAVAGKGIPQLEFIKLKIKV
ncbi:MAG: ATP-binding protein [Nitrosotalea sp.]